MDNKITEPFYGCEKCKDTNGFIHEVDEHGQPVTRKCECLIEHQKTQWLNHQLHKSNLSRDIKQYDIDSYIGDQSIDSVDKLKKYVHEFSQFYHKISLYLYGPNGTQKTTVAKWIGREVLKQHFSVFYVLMDNLVKALVKEGFDDSVEELLQKARDAQLLIIDESFDKSKVTLYNSGYQIAFLDRLLRQRLEETSDRATLFISNNPVGEIKQSFGQSIHSLIERNTQHTQLYFGDHYAKANNFEAEDIWGDN